MKIGLGALFAAAALASALARAGDAPEADEGAPEGTYRARVVGVRALWVAGEMQFRITLQAEAAGERSTVDIYVGRDEGKAIARALTGTRALRPMTHDLFASLLSELDARILRLTISSLEENVFVGKLVIAHKATGNLPPVAPEGEDKGSGDGGEIVIDSRPSDGMALAAAAGAPIYVSKQVVQASARRREADADEQEDEDEEGEEGEQDEEDEGELPVRPRPFGPPRDLI